MATDSHGSGPLGFGVPRTVVEDILSERRCRLLLSHLARRDSESVTDIARAVVAEEQDIDPADVPADERRAVREEIYQTHLPTLTATGIVEYDSMRGVVELATPAILQYVEESG